MATFTIRVELKGNPSYESYELLHSKMAALGFYRFVDGVNTATNKSERFNLPTGLYFGASAQSVSGVRDVVTKAAQSIQSGTVIFAAETANWAYNNTN